MKKKLIALILCICLISSVCIQPAYAMGAEGAIIGGGAAAAGITLTMPQVALLVAAGFGVVYAINHADDIANGLNNALNNAATNISNGIEELNYWKEQAGKGLIALSSAPAWIMTAIKGWIGEQYEPPAVNLGCTNYSANQTIPSVTYWSGTSTYSFPVDGTVIRTGFVKEGTTVHTMSATFVFVSETKYQGCKELSLKSYPYEPVYYNIYSWGTNPEANKPLSEYNQKAWDFISTLPNTTDIRNRYPSSYSTEKALIAALYDGVIVPGAIDNITPNVKIGGIENAMGQHSLDNIKFPDLDIGGSKLLNPTNGHTGSFDETFSDVMTGLKDKEITWEQYVGDVAVGTPTVSIPAEGEATGTLEYPITDTGVSDVPLDTTIPENPVIPGKPSVEVPEGLEPFTISLKDFFPFCIPFDIADFINVLCAEPEAPSFEWEFPSVDGTTEKLTIDLSPFDSAAQLLRNMELLLFCIGLALMTRNLIRG